MAVAAQQEPEYTPEQAEAVDDLKAALANYAEAVANAVRVGVDPQPYMQQMVMGMMGAMGGKPEDLSPMQRMVLGL